FDAALSLIRVLNRLASQVQDLPPPNKRLGSPIRSQNVLGSQERRPRQSVVRPARVEMRGLSRFWRTATEISAHLLDSRSPDWRQAVCNTALTRWSSKEPETFFAASAAGSSRRP